MENLFLRLDSRDPQSVGYNEIYKEGSKYIEENIRNGITTADTNSQDINYIYS